MDFFFPENGVTKEMLLQFQENDISDLFKNFSDRFTIRRYIKNIKSLTPMESENSELFCKSDMETDSLNSMEGDSKNMEESVFVTSPLESEKSRSCEFTADAMLEKKERRGKPTAAQLYFHNLIRDSASSAKIWKKTPHLNQISTTRKQVFLTTVIEAAPQLKSKEREIWRRLGIALQNRRKYMNDKESGKRKTTPTDKAEYAQIEIGDHVDLLTRDQSKAIGNGVVIKIDQMYSDVVLKECQPSAVPNDLELPEPVDGLTKLADTLIKRIIKWRTCRLRKHTRKKTSSAETIRGGSTYREEIESPKSGTAKVSEKIVKASSSGTQKAGTPKTSENKLRASSSGTPKAGEKVRASSSGTPKAGTPRANENKVIASYSETPKAGTPKTCEKVRASSSGTPKAGTPKTSENKLRANSSGTPKAGTPRENENKVKASYSETPKAGTPKTCEKVRASSSGTPKAGTTKTSENKVKASSSGPPKASENKVPSPKLSENEKEATLNQESDIIYEEKVEVGIFEWDRGELFLGMFKENGDCRWIINCEKPIAKIQTKPDPHLVMYLNESTCKSGICKLNRADMQPNPNTDYLVASARLRFNKEADMLIIKHQNKFISQVQEFFREYAEEKE